VTLRPKPKPRKGPLQAVVRAARGVVAAATMAGALVASQSPAIDDPTLFLKTSATQAEAPPPALMGYQAAWVADDAQLKIAEKGRRIGLTWAEASDNVLIAAAEGGSNVFYISATQDMAREYIEACAMWARVFDYAAGEIGEGIYDDGEARDGSRSFIKTYEIVFPKSGKRIVALSSRPTNLRGKQGVIVIDEAAFAQDLAGLLKAAMAMLLWGDKVRIISTHDGVENAFNGLILDVRAKKKGAATVHRITFSQAVEQGLYRRVCLRKGMTWTAEAEAAWVASAYAFYGDDAAEELDVVPSNSAGAYLSLALIEHRMTPITATGPWLVRGKWDDKFAYMSADVRQQAIRGWCEETLAPLLVQLSPLRRHVFSQDFARNRDQSIMVVTEEDTDLVKRPRLTVELANCPFTSQQQILEFIVDRLPRFCGGAMDATGNGAALAEAAAQKYGEAVIEQVKLNDGFYLQHMPLLKAGLADGTFKDIARDDALRDDLRAIKLIQGVPKIPKQDTQSAGAKAAAAEGGTKLRRHGDFAIAAFLALYAFTRGLGGIDWTPAPGGSFAERPDSRQTGLRMRPDTSSDYAVSADYGAKGGW
jgi:phage FluMu gp28-like protein